MTVTREILEDLNINATPGRRVQFHPSFCPEADGTKFAEWDTSHDVSAITPDGARYRVATYRHANDAAFVDALVNAYRNGNLVWKDTP